MEQEKRVLWSGCGLANRPQIVRLSTQDHDFLQYGHCSVEDAE